MLLAEPLERTPAAERGRVMRTEGPVRARREGGRSPQKRRQDVGKMSSILFFIAAIGVISGAVGVVVLRNPFYAVLSLVAHLLSLAVLFLLLRAEFVAAIQVVIYAAP